MLFLYTIFLIDSLQKRIYFSKVIPIDIQKVDPKLIIQPSCSRNQTEICISNVETLPPENFSYTINATWDQHFDINWNHLPSDIADCLNKGKRLDPRDRREFVRFVCRAIMDVCPKPKRRNLNTIVQKIVNRFPKSLGDTWCDEPAGPGFESLLRKVVYRIENLNRSVPTIKFFHEREKKRLTDVNKMHGCSKWLPVMLEDEEDLLKKKTQMKNMHANGCRNVDANVRTLLSQTYKLQRRNINEGCEINSLIDDWPFLFTAEGLLGHFSELIGIDVRSKIENALFVKGNKIVEFMSTISERLPKKEKLRDTLCEILSCGVMPSEWISDISGILVLIVEYFEETKDSIFVTVESAIPQAEVESLLTVQNITSPLLIVRGQSEFSYDSCMLCVNGRIIIDEIKSFKDAFICLFCIYCCFNIDYPHSATATFEFLQRCFFGINPEYGEKVKKCSKWKMNVKVTKLIEMLLEYEPELA